MLHLDSDPTGFRRVTLMKEKQLDYPDLYLEVFIIGEKFEERAFAQMFVQSHCRRAASLDKCDLAVFTGGSDVNPIYYDELPHSTTHYNAKRDEEDIKAYETCLNLGIPMFGVCRGAQFLHVMNGGKLYQDVDGHNGDHDMWDVKEKRTINPVSSVHHQMVIRQDSMDILGISAGKGCRTRWRNPTEKVVGTAQDVEAFFYRDTCCFGVQGHPEYNGYNEFRKWCLDQINELVVCNPDLTLEGMWRRMKPDLIEERNDKYKELLKEKN